MARTRPGSTFDTVRSIAAELPDVEEGIAWRVPVWRLRGRILACTASHKSAEPDTLVVRAELDARALLLEDAPETYYVTDYYEPYPVVLARLSRIDADALHDLLASSWRLSVAKTRLGRKIKKPSRHAGP